MPEIGDVVILCGGAGLRLRPITGEAPKSLAQVSGRPFLELLLRQLERYGFRRVILAIGYQGSVIQAHFGDKFGSMDVGYANELSPLGTGGALRNAAAQVQSTSCLVMNGDSYTDVALEDFIAAHRESKADVSIVVAAVDGRSDCGSISLDAEGNVLQFAEKRDSPTARYLNAGIYEMAREMLFDIPPETQISLERDLFPKWIYHGRRVRAFIHSGKCVDIGTPDRYEVAQSILKNFEVVTSVTGDKSA